MYQHIMSDTFQLSIQGVKGLHHSSSGISYLYKSWNYTCPDDTKSSIEDLHCCQGLAEEHDF